MNSSNDDDDGKVSETEIISSWAILIIVTLLLATFFTSYFLQRRKIRIVHESVVAIVLGMIAGLSLRLSHGDAIQKMVTFDHHYFFNLLLPPIILHSGYDLQVKHFFRNLGSILVFAFVGTILSAAVIGFLVYLMVLVGLGSLKLSFLECFMFGSILSSTDPVTVLSIFNALKVDPQLYAIIFGESMLNDAVALVLYGTLDRIRTATDENIGFGWAIGSFLGVFMGSFAIGVSLALLTALLLKYTELRKFPSIESCIVALLAYSTYLLSNAIQLSGIVSLLFCGMAMKHYAYGNLSIISKRTTRYFFQVMAHLSENFIFIYLGMTLFTKHDEVFRFWLVIFVFITLLIGRAASVFPLAKLINFLIDASQVGLWKRIRSGSLPEAIVTIPKSHQIMLWWAGLRGAIAFALSMDIQTPSANELRSTTLIVVVLSILIFGGSTTYALRRLKIRTGVDIDHDGHLDSPHSDVFQERKLSDILIESPTLDPSLEQPDAKHWFVSFDEKYLAPLFSRSQQSHQYEPTAIYEEEMDVHSVDVSRKPPVQIGNFPERPVETIGSAFQPTSGSLGVIPTPPKGKKSASEPKRSESPVRRRQWGLDDKQLENEVSSPRTTGEDTLKSEFDRVTVGSLSNDEST